MPKSPNRAVSAARVAAFEILGRVTREGAYASELLHSRRYASLSPADHGLATEIVMGVLRWQSRLDEEIATASALPLRKVDAEVLAALRIATYQLRHLDRIPARAAINESVELVKSAGKKSAAAFVNAVLRNLSTVRHEQRAFAASSAEQIATHFAHPLWLVSRWVDELGLDTTARVCAYNQQPPPTTIRLRSADAEEELRSAGVTLKPGSLLSSARQVETGDITSTPAFRQGRVVIQDEGSQLVAALVGPGGQMLDCCCAPGGKTSILADQNPSSLVVALELHPHRARLARKLVPQRNVRIVSADARHIPLSLHFDRVLADVPCSGTGTLARNPDIKWRLKFQDLGDLAARQFAILNSAVQQLSPGGRLIYSSCSLEHEEGADVVERALAENKGLTQLNVADELRRLRAAGDLLWPDIDSLVTGSFLRTLPGIHPCDGFFAAIVERSRD